MTKKLNTEKKTPRLFIYLLVAFVLGVFAGLGLSLIEVSFGSAGMCSDGTAPDKNGCCTGEIYTDMGDLGFNCCPAIGGDCYPPIR